EATWNRIDGFVRRATERTVAAGRPVDDAEVSEVALPAEFVSAMDDDLNVPAALAVVHDHLHRGNTALTDGTPAEVRAVLVVVRAMLDVLGLDPERWEAAEEGSRAQIALDALVRS